MNKKWLSLDGHTYPDFVDVAFANSRQRSSRVTFFMSYYAHFLFLLINEHFATSFGKFPPFGGMELAFPLERISSLRPATSAIRTLHVPAHSFRTLIRTRQRNLELAEGI